MLKACEDYKLEKICSWSEFLDWSRSYMDPDTPRPGRSIFRGEPKQYGDMTTSLERYARSFGIPADDRLERSLKNEFERRIKNYLPHVSGTLGTTECLAMMQHFGAPTRLLDWTYSPFIAAFFAFDKADNWDEKKEKLCSITTVIWALDAESYEFDKVKCVADIRKKKTKFNNIKNYARSKDEQDKVVELLMKYPIPKIVCVNPYYLNERLTIQQGVFLMPGKISLTFEENLRSDKKLKEKLIKIEITTSPKTRKDFLLFLHKMNINRATLFPGLQGFAESLCTRLAFPGELSE